MTPMTSLRMKALVGASALALIGCHRKEPAAFPTVTLPTAAYAPQSGSANAFDDYALAALNVEQVCAKYVDRTGFTPTMRANIIKDTAPALSQVSKGLGKPFDFKYTPHKPFEGQPYRAGWRLMDRALTWSIADACAAADFDTAISKAVLATRLGFDLSGGSALDASLGFKMADDARTALAPFLTELSTAQLRTLSDGLKSALQRKPPASVTISHERENMVLAVQAVQDAYQSGHWDVIQKNLGPDIKDAISYLKDLKSDQGPEYFQGFLNEGETECKTLTALSRLSVAERKKDPEPKDTKSRPWRRFSRNFFGAGRTFLDLNDRVVARTRLMVLEAELTRTGKASKALPASLEKVSKEINTDPYTGGPFMYRVDGLKFLVYSVGPDLVDDGGETDADYAKPDLMVERPRL